MTAIALSPSLTAHTGDVVIQLSENALNKFLAAHYLKHPEFYDHSRTTAPNAPLYSVDVDDHGTKRTIRLWAKVDKPAGANAVTLNLDQPPATVARYGAYWKATRGVGPTVDRPLPPRLALSIPRAVLQLNIPNLTGSGADQQLDIAFQINIETYAKLEKGPAGYDIKLASWDISVTPSGNPLDPNNPDWGGAIPAPCVQEVIRLRSIVSNILTLGANVALTQLAKTLTAVIALPPIDIVDGVKLEPSAFTVDNKTLSLAASISQPQIYGAIHAAFSQEIAVFELGMKDFDWEPVLAGAPLSDPDALSSYLASKVPAIAAIDRRCRDLMRLARSGPQRVAQGPALPGADLAVSLSPKVFDVLAKEFLKADQDSYTRWYTLDLVIGNVSGRAHTWLSLRNAFGGLNGTTIDMGCSVAAGGTLELKACLKDPCGHDHCATWGPGLGLKGPMDLKVSVNSGWSNNRGLKLSAEFGAFPGFEVYGLPPGVDDLVNLILNEISSVILRAFFNAILSVLNFYILKVPTMVPGTKVGLVIADFGSSNAGGYLVITGSTTFS
ncbi:Uncharacterised protein [Burkholderia pseudomallei]|uniref:hypothetical protein n=1 Tax=Burkholderia pseudomallei TaxID=28450 RepID=UPI000F170E54|nr:hypothetical protein [Burkholderia pseudomallei]CAJ3056622.1 Uncharacterised protein [Burkholderia pseudomallei]CAJ3559156.1 Uncharacterised protein [Burkholderia pseudomallei]CAJ3599854.1 Uncharacterised protein [Burkholderia pseudomallei]CAJ3649885.1 Uncharacterised protein [Burkholderia pseudomallei]CAJ3792026.1 Uncharacterised protein [Burkholderia pseudomallei]